jgi:peptidoglycan/LPS O-acetylase OafA/YrhL
VNLPSWSATLDRGGLLLGSAVIGALKLRRPNNFDVIRLVLAASVIVSHSFALPFGNGSREPLVAITYGQTTLGSVAVAGFFIVSGYLVTNSWFASGGFRPYITKRLLRVYPGYAVVILFGMLIIGPAFSGLAYFKTFNVVDVIRSFVIFAETPGQGFPQLPYHNLNGNLWTIQFEFACYLAMPLLLLLARSRRWPVVAALLLTLPVAALPVTPLGPDMTSRLAYGLHYAFGFASYFLAGMAMFLFTPKVTVPGVVLSGGLLALGALVPPLFAFVLPICGAYLLLALALCTPEVGRAFFSRYDLSYGTYLYGWPIGQVILLIVGSHGSPWLLIALTLPATLLVALGSWILVERRFIRMKPKARGGSALPAQSHAELPIGSKAR